MNDKPRLIEKAFPLKQTSLDSVHEKNVRHGHISTLHIWPARRPLAACRAALIATLLPDPGTPEKRKVLCEKIGGIVEEKIERKKMPDGRVVERMKEVTKGGILHWKRETENAEDLEWFRKEIRKAYSGRAPKVLDPFAGGGAIPLEAMRLGCEATAIDINPVAWFILKCTLEYPQRLAGEKLPLPVFILKHRKFMESFFKAQGLKGSALKKQMNKLGFKEGHYERSFDFMNEHNEDFKADLAWHVRAWGNWVLEQARKELAPFYPTYAEYQLLQKSLKVFEQKPMRLVPLKDDGTPDIDALNAGFTDEYLRDKSNPRWVAKPTVAYLWARTVQCKNCRATLPLLKTRWLCKKPGKRVLLTMTPNTDKIGVNFDIENDVPARGGNAAQRRENDRKLGEGTMSRSGAKCPCCGTIMTMEDIRLEGQNDRLGFVMTSIVINGLSGKEYMPTPDFDRKIASSNNLNTKEKLLGISVDNSMEPASTRSISCQLYGVKSFRDLFTVRQLFSLQCMGEHINASGEAMKQMKYPNNWRTSLLAYLILSFDRLLSFTCVNVRWKVDAEAVVDAFSRFSISLLWDFAEPSLISDSAGSWNLCYERIATALDTFQLMKKIEIRPKVFQGSAATLKLDEEIDLIITDPPYYQAISYADLSEFFYVWLRGFFYTKHAIFDSERPPKDDEIVQHIRHDKKRDVERKKYENGMANSFIAANTILSDKGRFVCVFAHKDPDAWDTLVNAIIRSGFVVTASWPIQTEMQSRQRAAQTSSLASSVWLVCKKRNPATEPGWDNKVLEEMQANIHEKMRDFWDAGIRGPDFVWAATGPALEAYSKHPVVKKANAPGQLMTVSEFLTHVRRIVVDFVVGRVLTGEGDGTTAAQELDDVTSYYLLHRHDFGLNEAPAGACILYAVSCGLSDRDLFDTWDILARTGGSQKENADPDDATDSDTGSGSKVKLKTWAQRKRKAMGYVAPGGRTLPLIDQVHRIMHFWKKGDVTKVDEYLDDGLLRKNELFKRLLQSIIELSPADSEERSILESISNHVQANGVKRTDKQMRIDNRA